MSQSTRVSEQRARATRAIAAGPTTVPASATQVWHGVVAAVDEGFAPPRHTVHRVVGQAIPIGNAVLGAVSTLGEAVAVGTPVLVIIGGGVPQIFVGSGSASALVPIHGHTSDSDGGFVAASVQS